MGLTDMILCKQVKNKRGHRNDFIYMKVKNRKFLPIMLEIRKYVGGDFGNTT